MKTMSKLLFAIALIALAKLSEAQNFTPNLGYVKYDSEGIARTVMNLNIKDYSGTPESM